MSLAPARLAPLFVPRIWGSRNLAPLFQAPAHSSSSSGLAESGEEPIGEVWLTGDKCVFDTGPLVGRSLGEAWTSLPAQWTGSSLLGLPRIPILVKFIFPEDNLSVQVHPGDDYAQMHEAGAGGVGKTEMWYAVGAREGAGVRLGFNPAVTPRSFERAIAEGTAEKCLQWLGVHAEDAFFVPAGVPHTIGPGMVLCEVQQHSDITYRVFDYNRTGSDGTPRPLHIGKALDVMKFGDAATNLGQRVEPVEILCGPLQRTYLAACPYFATERWQFSEPVAALTSRQRFELLIVLEGHGRVESDSAFAAYRAGECWFMPAALGAYRLTPDSRTTLLRTYVPDLREFERELAGQRVDEAARARVVHP
jgi:mannose-6-phosphate isomerase